MGLWDFLGVNTNEGDVKPVVSAGFDPNTYANNGAQNQSRDLQMQLAQALMAQSKGQGPSPTQTLLEQALSQNAAHANAMAMGSHGVNPGLALKQAMMAQNAATQNAAATAVAGRQQEMLNGQGMAANVAGGMRGQDLQNSGMYNQLGAEYAGLNTGVAEQNSKNNAGIVGGVLNAAGGMAGKAIGHAHGGVIPGKANVPGDSPENDTVDAKLSPGEIVIPRSKAKDPEMAKEFINHLMKTKKSKSEGGFGKVLEAHRNLSAALQALEKKAG